MPRSGRRIAPLLATLLALLAPAPARADCAAEIAALFDGGGFDAFTRPNMRKTTVTRAPDRSETPLADVLWDGPTGSITCMANRCFMAIGSKTWPGPGFGGPGTAAGDNGVADPDAFARATQDRLAASIGEPECLGPQSLSRRPALHYRFRSKPEPNEYGAW